MQAYYWNDLYSGWGWVLWFGMVFLFFSMIGNWGYTRSAHRLYREGSVRTDVLDILSERYARGDIQRDEYLRMKEDIAPMSTTAPTSDSARSGKSNEWRATTIPVQT